MIEFASIMEIGKHTVNPDLIVRGSDTDMGSIIKKSDPNMKYIMIVKYTEGQYIYLDLDKLVRDYNLHGVTIRQFMTTMFNDEILQGNLYTGDIPLLGRNIITVNFSDLYNPSVKVTFTNVSSGVDSSNIDDLSTPDLKISIPNEDHRYLVPIFDNKIYMNANPTSTAVVLRDVKDTIIKKYGKSFPLERLSFFDFSAGILVPKSVSMNDFSITSDGNLIVLDYSGLYGIPSYIKDVMVVINGVNIQRELVEFNMVSKTISLKANILRHCYPSMKEVDDLDKLRSNGSFVIFTPTKLYYENHYLIRDVNFHACIYTTQKLPNGSLMGVNSSGEMCNVICLESKLKDPAKQYFFSENYSGKQWEITEGDIYDQQIRRYNLTFQLADEKPKDGVLAPLYEDPSVYNSSVTPDKNRDIRVFRIIMGD